VESNRRWHNGWILSAYTTRKDVHDDGFVLVFVVVCFLNCVYQGAIGGFVILTAIEGMQMWFQRRVAVDQSTLPPVGMPREHQ
jgi:hypothetical protein